MTRYASTFINLACALFMAKFALPKLMGADISRATFAQFAEVLPVNATLYMYGVGLLELVIMLIMLLACIAPRPALRLRATAAGHLLLVPTLVVALLHEFYVRPAPIGFLVTLSGGFLILSGVQYVLWRRQFVVIKPFR